MPKVYQNLKFKSESVDETKFTLEGVFSTEDEDRHGDVVAQNWDLKTFKLNPVILNSHTYFDATEVIGKAIKIKVVDGKLEGKIQFAVAENPKAKIIFDLYKGGYLNAFSVGFIPKEFDNKNTILKSELLEISAVSVPANAYALAKSKGIDVDKLYAKDIEVAEIKKVNGEGDPGNGGDGQDGGGEGAGDGEGADEIKSKAYDYAEGWDEGDNEIRYKLRSLSVFDFDSFEKRFYHQGIPAVKAIMGKQTGKDLKTIQSLHFPKEHGWSIDDAKDWVAENTIALTEFKKQIKKKGQSYELALNSVEEKEEDDEKVIIDAQKNRFDKIQKAIKLVGEEIKVESRSKSVRAENNRLINKTIRELLKIKSK